MNSIHDQIRQHVCFLEENGTASDDPTIGILNDAVKELERLWHVEREGKLKSEPGEKAPLTPSECKSCQAPILWSTSKNGKPMPLDVEPKTRAIISPATGRTHLVATYMPHWGTCPNADQHRKGKAK